MVRQFNYINRHVSKNELIISNLFQIAESRQTVNLLIDHCYQIGKGRRHKKKLESEERIERESLCLQIKSSKYEGETPLNIFNYMQQNIEHEAKTHV